MAKHVRIADMRPALTTHTRHSRRPRHSPNPDLRSSRPYGSSRAH